MADRKGLYTADQIKQLEQLYARFHDGSTYPLMERAGGAVYNELRERWPDLRRILVVCGKGNNGGDGFVVARLAAMAGLPVTVALMPGAESPQGDAERAFARLKPTSANVEPWHSQLLDDHDVIVDAILGTGIKGKVKDPFATIINEIVRSNKPVISVDIPSGLVADTGAVLGSAIKADVTVSFIGIKRGMVTSMAADYCGELEVNDLSCGQGIFALVRPKAFLYRYRESIHFLEPRRRTAHKGFFGHVLVIGGAPGFAGAIRMAAEAAARTGAGLVSVLTHSQHSDVLCLNRPEIMCHSATDSASKEGLRSLLEAATVIAIGPGLGQQKWGRNLITMLRDYLKTEAGQKKKTVWDADALNLLSDQPHKIDNRVLTPHPGEAARLLNSRVEQVQLDRFTATSDIVERFGGVCLLKGAGTVIADDHKMNVVTAGNPGMASGGMGDVLTGIIAGLMAQGIPPFDAARIGAAIHGEAAELAVTESGQRQERGLLATDLFLYIRRLVNPESKN
ncbi:NAD(P)H-hydrate dehydratase [Pleionea sediminis]|uniref:NAD(P)H-hydrate dehydratase n=1 Tax=Pleionea sediminis TaxID=2569479 RepID=UPI0011870389|nr:NAD(P)H-hydrate dehydratase [Pleionea sediminis]